MQKTRKLILDYIKEHGETTVDELAQVLDLTSVTVRHHLDILRSQDLVADPITRHRATPGRPQYAYTLTDKASTLFPSNVSEVAVAMLDELKGQGANPDVVNVIFEGVAHRLAEGAPPAVPGEPFVDRLTRAAEFLNARGYVARWERVPLGFLFHTCHCPYDSVAPRHPELCSMDMALVGNLLGIIPERVSRVLEGDDSCSYFIREPARAEQAAE